MNFVKLDIRYKGCPSKTAIFRTPILKRKVVSKIPTHYDFKSVLEFIPSFDKAKDLEETILGQQNKSYSN